MLRDSSFHEPEHVRDLHGLLYRTEVEIALAFREERPEPFPEAPGDRILLRRAHFEPWLELPEELEPVE